jgi:alginate O-acetyltransferase complex protein AlgJ
MTERNSPLDEMAEHSVARLPPHRRTRLSLTTALLAGAIFFLPVGARISGRHGHPIENRAARPAPADTAGWSYFSDLGRYLADRLPLRSGAVRADGWVDENIFHEDPAFGGGATPRVIRGSGGVLYLADAIDNACEPHSSPGESARNLGSFAGIIRASGREVVTMVAPDKSTAHPELLPTDLPKIGCFARYTEALWGALAAADIAGYTDLRSLLATESARSRELLYLRKDSHWDSAGSLVSVRAAVDLFAPGLFTAGEVSYTGLKEYTGDLSRMQGKPDQAPSYTVVRPGVVSVSNEAIDTIEGGFNRRYVNTASGGRLISGKSLMFLDSFGLAALPQIVPYFEDLTVMRLVDFEPIRYAQLIGDSDRVWIMSVERSLSYRFAFEIGSADFLSTLKAELPMKAHP